MIRKLLLFFNTIRHLKVVQVKYQLKYIFINLITTKPLELTQDTGVSPIFLKYTIVPENNSYHGEKTFQFLNIKHQFDSKIDWELMIYGKLWQYNLTYFDYLNNSEIQDDTGISLIKDFISNQNNLRSSIEPYPISLRLMNWIRFISTRRINDSLINNAIFVQANRLVKRLEYHLLGNHLLENAFCLLHVAIFLRNEGFYKKAKVILLEELQEQILDDGAHFELSPMYHQIILFRLLEAIDILNKNLDNTDKELIEFMTNKASDMLNWLNNITFINGDIPLVNDSANGITFTTTQLQNFAKILKISPSKKILSVSGYRKFVNDTYEAFVDVGEVGPSYQPGHAHADMLNLIIYCNKEPLIVEVGTSTYQINPRRLLERSTESHNTVVINKRNQSQVWSGFRVAKRAKMRIFEDRTNLLIAQCHNYNNFIHERQIEYLHDKLIVQDSVNNDCKDAVAYWHFHPNINIKLDGNLVFFENGKMELHNFNNIIVEDYYYAPAFNQTSLSKRVKVNFQKNLVTQIYFSIK